MYIYCSNSNILHNKVSLPEQSPYLLKEIVKFCKFRAKKNNERRARQMFYLKIYTNVDTDEDRYGHIVDSN